MIARLHPDAPERDVIPFLPQRQGRRVGGQWYLRPIDTLTDGAAKPYLLKGIINEGELSVWFGKPGCGKSFLMLGIAYAMAQGRSIFARRVKASPVIYYALEAGHGVKRRVAALHTEHGDAPKFCVNIDSIDFWAPAAVENVIAAIHDFSAKFVVIDTLACAMGGAPENEMAGMGAFLSVATAIKTATGAHVALTHHSGKNEESGPRGHSALTASVDLQVAVRHSEDGVRRAKIEKLREGEAGFELSFGLRQIALGTDADGEPVTTCVAEEVDAAPIAKRPPRLLVRTELAWRVICDEFAKGYAELLTPLPGMRAVYCIAHERISAALMLRGFYRDAVSDGVALSSYDRGIKHDALNLLVKHGFIGRNDKFIWLLSDSRSPPSPHRSPEFAQR